MVVVDQVRRSGDGGPIHAPARSYIDRAQLRVDAGVAADRRRTASRRQRRHLTKH